MILNWSLFWILLDYCCFFLVKGRGRFWNFFSMVLNALNYCYLNYIDCIIYLKFCPMFFSLFFIAYSNSINLSYSYFCFYFDCILYLMKVYFYLNFCSYFCLNHCIMYSNCDVDIYFYNFSTMVDNSKDLVYILNII